MVQGLLSNELYPSNESKTIYVDWLDDKGTVLSHTMSPVLEASSTGQFAVPEAYTGSVLHVRAYTRWMLNFDTSFIYAKQLRVLGVTPPGPVKTKTITSIQFLPEGGDAIAGLKTKVAFKATDQWGTAGESKWCCVRCRRYRNTSVQIHTQWYGYFLSGT
jgi:hypothetical protein